MDKYLPTGNDFVSLPRINERTGGIEDITFLYMAAKGLIDIRGSKSTPLIQPYVHLDGVGSLSPAHLAWTRLDDWLPQSTAQLGSLELKTLYVPPIDERGFAIQMTVHNTSESAQDVVIGLNGCWASSWHCVNEDKPLSGKATCFRSGWNSSLIFEYHAGFPMFSFALWPMHKQILLLPVPMMAVLLTIYPITVQLLPMEQPQSYFIGVSVSRKLLPQQALKRCFGKLSM